MNTLSRKVAAIAGLKHAMIRCSNCHMDVLESERHCRSCDLDVGYLNVRHAQKEEEQSALNSRVANVFANVDARDCRAIYDQFVCLAAKSKVAIASNIAILDDIMQNDYKFIISYHRQVNSGSRRPETNVWDQGRISAEQLVNPFCYEDIIFGALSIDGYGLSAWGRYSINIKEICISHRTTVFEENPFHFHQRHVVVGGSAVPPGFRADWNGRGILAAVKLHNELTPSTNVSDFPKVLMRQGTNTGNAEYVEVHICGKIHRSAIDRVIAKLPIPPEDKPIWKRVKRMAKKLSVIVEEV